MAESQLTMRVMISAMHSLENPKLSDAKNLNIFGKCFRLHGHNYYLEVTVKGQIDPESGLCCDRDRLAELLDTHIVKKFNGTFLNDHFDNTSGEALAQELFKLLKPLLEPINLIGVRLQETPKNFFSFGESQNKISDFRF